MKVENGVRILAGTMILLSLYLTWFVNKIWVWLTVFVALNLIQSAFTGLCPAAFFLKKLGLKTSCEAPPKEKNSEEKA